jgi:hypothetical protein
MKSISALDRGQHLLQPLDDLVDAVEFNLETGAVDKRRVVMSAIFSTSTSPFWLRVSPVYTRSTMRSEKPHHGASSMEPYSLMDPD